MWAEMPREAPPNVRLFAKELAVCYDVIQCVGG